MAKLFSEQLRAEIMHLVSLSSQRQFGQDTGINHSVISRFLDSDEKGSLTLEHLDKLFKALKWKVVFARDASK